MIDVLFFGWTLCYISVVEYLIHRRAMHGYFTFPYYLYKIGIEHRTHHRGANQPEYTTISAIKQSIILSPILITFLYFGLYSFFWIMLITVSCYCLYWNQLHAAFHGTGGSWCKRIPWYGYQCHHHLTHHARPNCNFSGIFAPILDNLCGTKHVWNSEHERARATIQNPQSS